MISPNVLVKGGDYKINEVVGVNFMKSVNGKVKIIKTKKGYSTSKLLMK